MSYSPEDSPNMSVQLSDSELIAMTEPTLRMAANQIQRRYRDYADLEDLAQTMRLWVWAHRRKVREWLEVAPDDKAGVRAGAKALHVTLTRVGEQYARKERATMLGYKPEDEWFANKAVLVELLPIILGAGEDGFEVQAPEDTGGRAKADPAEGNERAALIADAARAWKVHPDPILEALYGPSARSRQEVADDLGISYLTVQRRENAAIRLLIDYLGGQNPW